MAHKVIVPPKKIMSRSFLNSGTLIVILHESYPCRLLGLTSVEGIAVAVTPPPLYSGLSKPVRWGLLTFITEMAQGFSSSC
jgi:hypothetical protein